MIHGNNSLYQREGKELEETLSEKVFNSVLKDYLNNIVQRLLY
jgi:hypothetical protein